MYLHPTAFPVYSAPHPEPVPQVDQAGLDRSRSFELERSFFGWLVRLIENKVCISVAQFDHSDADYLKARDLGSDWVSPA